MNQSRTDTLKVPGATLYYEVRGAGPVLLLIPGGPADAGGFAPIRDILSDRYTVAVGEASKRQLAHRAALALAGRLGKEPTILPGGHSGIGSDPKVFADRLHEMLSSTGVS